MRVIAGIEKTFAIGAVDSLHWEARGGMRIWFCMGDRKTIARK